MQTFLPYASFAASAAVLDGPRLGKQRVETLQILRAIVVPTYGWRNHPAVGMWRGFVPGLTAYGLATTDEWTRRGAVDSIRPQLLEFAPEVDGLTQAELAEAGLIPPWVGDEALHESHRSNLIRKAPERYAAQFPGTADDLDYIWPTPAEPPAEPFVDGLIVLRVDDAGAWRSAGLIGMRTLAPSGKAGPAWRQQLADFDALTPGTVVAVLGDDDPTLLHLAAVTGAVAPVVWGGADHLAAAARFEGDLSRASLPVPALLQNPRRLFRVPAA